MLFRSVSQSRYEEKAIRKTERWMRAAYGDADWDELEAETGSAVGVVMGYLVETLKEPSGTDTFNRKTSRGKF